MSTMHVRPTPAPRSIARPWSLGCKSRYTASGIQSKKVRPNVTIWLVCSRQETSAVDQSSRGSRSFPKKTRQLKDVQYRSLCGITKHANEARLCSKMPKQKQEKEAFALHYHMDLIDGQCSWLRPYILWTLFRKERNYKQARLLLLRPCWFIWNVKHIPFFLCLCFNVLTAVVCNRCQVPRTPEKGRNYNAPRISAPFQDEAHHQKFLAEPA